MKIKVDTYNLTQTPELKDERSIDNFLLIDVENYGQDQYPVILSEITFSLCTKGEGIVRINFKEYVVRENSILVIPPGSIIQSISRSDDFEMSPFFFSVDFVIEFFRKRDFNVGQLIREYPCLEITPENMELLKEFYMLIKKLYNSDEPPMFREGMIRGVVYAFLLKVGHSYSLLLEEGYQRPPYKEDLFDKFLSLLQENYKNERQIGFYADKLCVTSKHLSTTIKKITGRTAPMWINEVVIMNAKILLKTTEQTITQIADELNFPNPSFFGRFFKKHAGMTPKKYRES